MRRLRQLIHIFRGYRYFMHKFSFKLCIFALIVSMNGQMASADEFSRQQVSQPRLLHKILKNDSPLKRESNHEGFDKKLLTSRFSSWGIDPENKSSNINLSPVWEKFKKRKEIVVAVIDTGIDPKHPFLAHNLYVTKGMAGVNNYGLDFSKNRVSESRPFDSHGHGTHVAGIVKSIHPEVKILTLKYYNPKASGQDNLNSTIEALRYAVNQNVDIINYSGGGPEPALEELRILKLAEKKGILVVAAAGNEESNIDKRANAYYPASYGLKNIITVTAYNQSLQLLNSSNYGKETVDISAPGYRIKSSLPNGRAGYLTGTSQATAFVTGVAALMMSQYPELTAVQTKAILKKAARKEATLLTKCSSGGRLDADRSFVLANEFIKSRKKARDIANRFPNSVKEKKKKMRRSNRRKAKKGKIIFRKSS
jgi:subtilisin family serine protease